MRKSDNYFYCDSWKSHQKRSKEIYTKKNANRIKSDNLTRINREKSNIFSLKLFFSHITKFPRGFSSTGIYPFTGIYLAGFFHSPRFFLSSRGFFHSLWFESLIFIQNSKILKEMVRRFFTFRTNDDFGYASVHHWFPWVVNNIIPPSIWREQWHISSQNLTPTFNNFFEDYWCTKASTIQIW